MFCSASESLFFFLSIDGIKKKTSVVSLKPFSKTIAQSQPSQLLAVLSHNIAQSLSRLFVYVSNLHASISSLFTPCCAHALWSLVCSPVSIMVSYCTVLVLSGTSFILSLCVLVSPSAVQRTGLLHGFWSETVCGVRVFRTYFFMNNMSAIECQEQRTCLRQQNVECHDVIESVLSCSTPERQERRKNHVPSFEAEKHGRSVD